MLFVNHVRCFFSYKEHLASKEEEFCVVQCCNLIIVLFLEA